MNYTRAYVAVPMKMVCDPELPNNEGTYLPMRIQAPEGCLLNPTYPAACFWRLAAGMLVSDLMFRILADIAPDRAPAESGSLPTWQFYVNGVRRNGELFALHQHAFGGMGGRPGRDGLGSISFPYNVRDVSIEWSEVETPVLFERRELIAESGGPGRWRGGLGEELVLAGHGDVDAAVPLILSGSAGRMAAGPLGLFGGGAGGLGRISVDGEPIPPTSSPNVAFHSGQRLSLRCPGGGGHGKPGERPAAAILADLADGYVTPVGAKRDYGYPRGEATEEDETP